MSNKPQEPISWPEFIALVCAIGIGGYVLTVFAWIMTP